MSHAATMALVENTTDITEGKQVNNDVKLPSAFGIICCKWGSPTNRVAKSMDAALRYIFEHILGIANDPNADNCLVLGIQLSAQRDCDFGVRARYATILSTIGSFDPNNNSPECIQHYVTQARSFLERTWFENTDYSNIRRVIITYTVNKNGDLHGSHDLSYTIYPMIDI